MRLSSGEKSINVAELPRFKHASIRNVVKGRPSSKGSLESNRLKNRLVWIPSY